MTSHPKMGENHKNEYFHKSIKYVQKFRDESPSEMSNFVRVQRLLWEKSLFPRRFPSCTAFLCSFGMCPMQNISFCLQCGRTFCINHFDDHQCSPCFGVDVKTRQLFFFEKGLGRRFVFDPSIDYLVLSSKLAVLDGFKVNDNIVTGSSIFPTHRSPMPLQNLGNTCWMNSLLQCFAANPLLQKWFLSEAINIQKIECPEAAVHNHLCRLFLAQIGEASFSPTDYFFAVWMMAPQFATPEQCDSHEFFMTLRTKLDEFYQKKFESQTFSNIFSWQFKVIESCENCGETRTFIEQSFDVMLNIENCSSMIEALNNFLYGTSPRNCNNCQRLCKRQYFFNTLPATLSVALVRASYSDKSVKNVLLPEEFSLEEYIDSDKKNELGDTRYSLIGTVVRPGSGETGHYLANVKKYGQWYRCDDITITPVESNSILRDDACLAFYVRRGFVIV